MKKYRVATNRLGGSNMKQTIENMTIVLTQVENEIKLNNIKESKTLMNTYRTLGKKLWDFPNCDLVEHEQAINEHLIILDKLKHYAAQSLKVSIQKREYKKADNSSEIDRRISQMVTELKSILKMSNRRSSTNPEMDVALVDGRIDFTTLHILNTNNGEVKLSKRFEGKLKDQVDKIAMHVIKNRPTMIIFDKQGVGLALYESFIKYSEGCNYSLEKNGKIIYK